MITAATPVNGAAPDRRHHLRAALRLPHFRKLFAVRLSAQFGDGVFQASLAGAVLFSPDRQAHASDVAIGFAILLLPYSIIGPFAGVLLDRWWRQRVLVTANLVRVAAILIVALEISTGLHGDPFYASALVVLSISRFFLAALSASLPHVISSEELVTANALSTTLGAVATTSGGGAAIGVGAVIGSGSTAAYASIAAAATLPYLLSALAARRFGRTSLGPDDVERQARETLAQVARGLVAGARYLHEQRPAFLALSAVAVHRLCYGLFAVTTLLLFRNYFQAQGPLRVGLSGLAQAVAALAIGGAVAALITPTVTRRIGFAPWASILLAASGVVSVALVLPYRLPLHMLAATLIGFCGQGIKICVDTTVQRTISDEFRGRTFAIYDTVFNLALVSAAVLTAVALPDNGRAPGAVIVISGAYVLTGLTYLRLSRRGAPGCLPAAAPTTA